MKRVPRAVPVGFHPREKKALAKPEVGCAWGWRRTHENPILWPRRGGTPLLAPAGPSAEE